MFFCFTLFFMHGKALNTSNDPVDNRVFGEIINYRWFACDVMAAMLVHRKIFVVWDLTSIFMQTI